MKNKTFSRYFLVFLTGLVLTVLMAGEAQCREGPLLLARGPVGDVPTVAPPPDIRGVAPPPDIRQIPSPPPLELRQIQPPEEIRKVAPPPDAGAPPTLGPLPQTGATSLAVVTVGLSNANPKVGERVFATATLRNKGSRNLSGVRVRFYLDQAQVGERVVDVAAGGRATASASFKASKAGAQSLKVQADPGSGIAPLTLARGLTVTGAAKTDVEDFTTPAKKPKADVAKGPEGDQAPLSPQRIPFDKPLLAKKGTELAQSPVGREPGSPPGSGGTPAVQDPTGGWGDRNKLKGVPETTPWGGGGGPGKSDLGDGIEGIHNQGDLPKKDYGKDIPDPRQGPGHKTAGHGWGKDQYGQPMFKTPGGKDEGYKDDLGRIDKSGPFSKGVGGPGFWFGYASTYWKKQRWEEIVGQGGTPRFNVGGGGNPELGWWREDVTYDDGTVETTIWAKDGSSTKITKRGTNVITTTYDKTGKETGTTTSTAATTEDISRFFGLGGYPRPEGGESKPTDKSEITLLLLRVEQTLPSSGEEHRGDPLVSDPAPIKGGKDASGPEGGISAAKGVELAAAGAAKAKVAWRFAGKKPGSEVTDPAEWQDRKIRDLSMARIKHFEVIDPVEAPGLQGTLAKAQAGALAGAGGPALTVTSVAGGVQKLTTREGKQGWAPLKAGDKLSPGSAIRLSPSGGEVGTSNLNAVLSLKWTLVQQNPKGKVYLLQSKK